MRNKEGFSWIICILLIDCALSEDTCERSKGLGQLRFGEILPRSAFTTRYQISLYQCATECQLRRQRCKSFNYRRSFLSCQLCEQDSGPEGINLRPEAGAVHSNIDTWKIIRIGNCNAINCSWTESCDSSKPTDKSACVPTECRFAVLNPGVTIEPSNETAVGTKARYRCVSQNMERGDPITTCLESRATWSTTVFKCVCGTPLAKSGTIKENAVVEVGQNYTFRCQDGLFGKSDQNPTVTCLPDGSWTSTSFSCDSTSAATTMTSQSNSTQSTQPATTNTSETSTTSLPTTTFSIATSTSPTSTLTQSVGTSTTQANSTWAATTSTTTATTTGATTMIPEIITFEASMPTISTTLKNSTTSVPTTLSSLTTSTSQATTLTPCTSTIQTTSTSATSTASSTIWMQTETTISSSGTTSSTQVTPTTTAYTFTTDDCYTDSVTYTGGLSVTVSGRMCQAWSLNTPHYHFYHSDSMFPDGKVKTAANFCRDPSRDGFLWCYTVDPGKRWDKCLTQSCKVTDSTSAATTMTSQSNSTQSTQPATTNTSETSTTSLPTTTFSIATSTSPTSTLTQYVGTSTTQTNSTWAATTSTTTATTTGATTVIPESITSEASMPTTSTTLKHSTTSVPTILSSLTTSTSQATTLTPCTSTIQTTSTSATSTASSTIWMQTETTTSSSGTTSSTQVTPTTTAYTFTTVCTTPPAKLGAINEKAEVEVGQNYTYRCQSGLFGKRDQNPTVTCLQDGNWTSTNFTCVCNTPPAIRGAINETSEVEVGQKYTYRCQSGLFEKGAQNPTVTCQHDGSWTSTNFICVNQNWKQDTIYPNNIHKSDVISTMTGIDFLTCMQQCDDKLNYCLSFFYENHTSHCVLSTSFRRGLPQNFNFSDGIVYYTAPSASCDMEYKNVSLGGSYFCVKFHDIGKTFNEAMQLCESEKAKLLVITTKAQVADAKKFINDVFGWGTYLGMWKETNKNRWVSWDGEEVVPEWNLNPIDPTNLLEDCAHIYFYYDGVCAWSCKDTLRVLCHKKRL